MKKDSFASPWKKVAENWEKYYAPPGRPSPEDCKHYEDYIRRAINGKPAKALVLGATPEVRNALHKFPIEVTTLDINLEMILAMNQFVEGWEKDIIVRDSWINTLLADNYFDIILGDLTWGNVPKEQWDTFHQNMKRVIKPGGYYIHRVNVFPDDWRIQSTEESLKEYSKRAYTHSLHFELFFRLLWDSYDSKDKTFSMARIREGLKPFWKDGKMTKGSSFPGVGELLNKIFAFWGVDSNKTWQFSSPGELKKSIEPYFIVLEELLSKDYLYSEGSPFWFCQVKK
jgi:SAM-dependent methyltransferase